MHILRYLWLLLCYAQYARTSILSDYAQYSTFISSRRDMDLPIKLSADGTSGCTCRANKDQRHIVCFGGYDCKTFPKVKQRSEALRVRTSVITRIDKGEIDNLFYLKILEIEANHNLTYLEPGLFSNLTNLEQLSITYNTKLRSINEALFVGLKKLRNLTMVNNGFTILHDLALALQPKYLPSLQRLDLSENIFGSIPYDAFAIMEGTRLNSLKIALCQIDYIHPSSFTPLERLKELNIANNDLEPTIIENFLRQMSERGINLYHLDVSSMGFKKYIPRMLLIAIAESTIKRLVLAQNKFETISNTSFPTMRNIELLDLSEVSAVCIDQNAFNPQKFPNLKALFLNGNNLPGIHAKHLSNQLKLLDMSKNSGNPSSPVYFEIAQDTFEASGNLQVLNLSSNRIKSIFDYTFRGLTQLRILNIGNSTLYHIGPGTFLSTPRLEVLNLAGNPLTASENLTSAQFEGLSALKVLILSNCGIRYLYEADNIFQGMPNITHLILKENMIMYVPNEIISPLKRLKVIDLSGNLLIAWFKPLFVTSGIKPQQILIANNKITHFTVGMLRDIDYLLANRTKRYKFEIDFMDNVFVCDCSNMYTAFVWLETRSSPVLKQYFNDSNFVCSTPDLWENRRIIEYFSSIKSLQCAAYAKISNMMLLMWTLPSIVVIILILVVSLMLYKYRFYLRYWIFLAKIALGRTLRPCRVEDAICVHKEYKYDAFVSYCNDDKQFVVEMISEMETKPPHLKLCIYERDFEVGSFISESIMAAINDSRLIVLVISNNFAKSYWCRWETQLAEYHRLFLEDGTCCDPLVLVRVGDVETKYQTPTLRYLLKTKIYLSWTDQSEDFWSKLRKVLAKEKQ